MERTYYEKYYFFERTHWWFVVRGKLIRNIFAKYAGKKRDQKILNTGVATGRSSEIVSEFGEVSSIETDKNCCDFVRLELKMEVTQASVTEMPFPSGTFHVVCAFDVLEHIEDDSAAVKELNRVNVQNGWLFVTVPANQWLWSRHDDLNHHYRRYSRERIANILEENGYQIEYLTWFNTFLFLPIVCYRLLSNAMQSKKRHVKSDFEIAMVDKLPFLNKVFYSIFNLERKILLRARLPFGVSILVLAKKIQ